MLELEPESEHDCMAELEIVSDSPIEEPKLDPDSLFKLDSELEYDFVAEPEIVANSDLPPTLP